MKLTKKKLAVIGAVVFLLGSLSLGYARYPRHGGAFVKHVLWKMDDHAEDLKLDALQQEQYKQIRDKLEVSLTQGMGKRETFFHEIKSELDKADPDVPGLTEKMKAHLAEFPEAMSANLDLMVEFYNILNDDQKTELMNDFRKRLNRMEQFMPGQSGIGNPES